MKKKIVSIQGYDGSFHAQAARKYFAGKDIDLMPADSFEILGKQVANNASDIAVMAIENSIAGTILQNYRILRERSFWIEGEVFLRIEHCFMTNKETNLGDITQIISHPMALNQCLDFILQGFPNAKMIESEDTALSAIKLAANPQKDIACIASKQAGVNNNLKIWNEGIESNKSNYTRFFIVKKEPTKIDLESNKASLYIKIPDQKGQLLKVLQVIHDHDLNLSKLQSFPVMGSFREYFFHIDIEFDNLEQYYTLKEDLLRFTSEYKELGIYKRADEDIISVVNRLEESTKQNQIL
jgi:prephenate dehydratase